MQVPSSPVTSRQASVHPRLLETLERQRRSPWQRPASDEGRRGFDRLAASLAHDRRPRILDSGCGTGLSTRRLAQAFPEALVLGVDKSQHRLEKADSLPENARLVRLDLLDFWTLARSAGWTFTHQFFLYPNPWPKPEQRQRRWAFHPVLAEAVACGGVFEVRTNWRVYADEFATACRWYGLAGGEVEAWSPSDPLTLFEKKYQASGHPLWRWVGAAAPGP